MSKKRGLSKKVLLIAAVILAVFFALFLLRSANGTTAQAAQTGTVVTRKLLEDDTYEFVSGGYFYGVYQKKDETEYKVVWYDGTVTTIEDKEKKINRIKTFGSTGVGFQLLEILSNGRTEETIINKDGSYLGGKKGTHNYMGLLNSEKNKDFYYMDENDRILHICAENGAELCSANIPKGNYLSVCLFGNYYGITFGSDYMIIDQSGQTVKEGQGSVSDVIAEKTENGWIYYDTKLNKICCKEDKLIHFYAEDGSENGSFTLPEDYLLSSWYFFGEYYGINGDYYRGGYLLPHYYCIIDRKGQIKKEGRGIVDSNWLCAETENGEGACYDTKLNKVRDFKDSFEYSKWKDLEDSKRKPYHDDLIPNIQHYYYEELESLSLPPALAALRYKIDGKLLIGNTSYFMLSDSDEEGRWYDEIVDSEGQIITRYERVIGDHIIVMIDENGTANAVEYTAVPEGSVIVQLKNDGSASASVIAAGTKDEVFDLAAAKDIVPDGSIFRVVKIAETEKEMANAKDVLKNVTKGDRFAAYDISLLNSSNEKIQPKGTLSIRTAVPAGFDAGKVGVFRINDDKTYTELKASVADGQITFETDHFSTYVIAEKVVATSPNTGDHSNVVLWAVLLLGSILVLFGKKWWERA